MKTKFTLLGLLISALLQSFVLFAQNIPVSGKVLNKATGEVLSGATITIKGSSQTVLSDSKGQFSINVPGPSAVLQVSYTGMKAQELTINAAATSLMIKLEEAAETTLSDVVVVGYGTQRLTKVSGAISTIKAADIEKARPVRVEEALQGRAAGVNVIQPGTPGAKPTVLIRGIPSFSGTDPVVIIDGVPQTLTDFNSISPTDIESINVLKDAATAAIYGVKGGNGVIVVTTRSGRKSNKTDITINSNYGIQEVINTVGVLNGAEYAAMINEGSTVAGGPVIFSDLSTVGVGTNWQNEVFKRAPLQSHTISARGGADRMGYFLSAGFVNQSGIVGGNDKSRFSRGNFTANLNFDLSSKVKLLINTTGVILDSKGIQENSFNSVLGSALNFDPTVAVKNSVPNTPGQYGFSNLILSEVFNPLTKLENTYNKNVGSKLYGKFELQYDILKNLKLSSRFGYTKYDGNAKSFTPLVFYGPNNIDNSMNADGSAVAGRHNSVAHEKVSNFNYTWETFANYNFEVGSNHRFETVAGFAMSKVSGNAAGATRQDVPFNSWEFADFTAATGNNISTNTNALSGYYYQYFRRNLSYFGRVNYDYDNRYLLSATLRRDGSYAFGIQNKYANFLSGSAGWVVSNESFFRSKNINYLKLRASYGVTGNENVDPQFVSIVTGGPSYGPTANSNGYNFNNIFYAGSTVGSAANDALRWEKQTQLNAGFDISLFDKRISLSADYFQKEVDGLLFTPSASYYLGTVPIPTSNIGATRSTGVDITLGFTETIAKQLKVSTSFTFTTAKNEVTATNSDGTARILGGYYFNGQSQSVTVFEKGFTPGYFYGYKTDGLFQNDAEIAAAATQPGAVPGDIRFVDMNKDGVINAQDMTQIGDPFPDFTVGGNLSLEYKGFDFTTFAYASVGNDVYRAYERNAIYSNKDRRVLARWTGEGTTNDAKNPRYTFVDANSNIRVSDRYVEDGSFLKIKNIQLGYTFPSKAAKKWFSSLRVYAQVRNAFVFTNYSGFDPEISGGILDTGVDRGSYPQPRTYTLGIDIKL
ncbi:MAG: SusC/RagA family TonB-linked outer membrane protein [Chitinophagaceae bacterium]